MLVWLVACAPDAGARVEAGLPDAPVETVVGEPGPLVINEFMPENDAAWAGPAGDHPDWVELYNPSDAAVDLTGWGLADDRDAAPAPLAGTVAAWGWALFDTPSLGFGLDPEGGEVVLSDPAGGDRILAYGHVADDFSVARLPDGCAEAGCLDFVWRGTPGATNGAPAR